MRCTLLLPVPILFLLTLVGCTVDCPPHSRYNEADGLCYLVDTDDGGSSNGNDSAPGDSADSADSGAPLSWQAVPSGCGLASKAPDRDPLRLVGDFNFQAEGGFFAEMLDIEADPDSSLVYAVGQGGLMIMDTQTPTPTKIYTGTGSTSGGESRYDNLELGPEDVLYATNTVFGLITLDRTTPASPQQLQRTSLSDLSGMAHNTDYLYVTRHTGELITYSLSNPRAPQEQDRLSGLGNPWEPVLQGDRLYIADNTLGVGVVSLADPAAPALVGYTAAAGGVQDLAFSSDGQTLYAAVGGAGVQVFSLDDPDHPTSIDTISLGYSVISVSTAGGVLWAANQQDVVALDINADPRSPGLLNSEKTAQWSMHVAAVEGARVHVADWAILATYQLNTTLSAPDAALSSSRVFLTPGEPLSLSLSNLGSADLSLLGAQADTDALRVEADRLSLGSGASATLRLSLDAAYSGGDFGLCLSTNDPDEPDQNIEVVVQAPGDTGVGGPAPDFTLTDLDGNTLTLSDQLGKPVVLAYFATW